MNAYDITFKSAFKSTFEKTCNSYNINNSKNDLGQTEGLYLLSLAYRANKMTHFGALITIEKKINRKQHDKH